MKFISALFYGTFLSSPHFIFLYVDSRQTRAHWLSEELISPNFSTPRWNYVKPFLGLGISYRPLLSHPSRWFRALLGHMALRRETRGLSVKIYFFILAHLVALLSEVNILFNLFTSGKLCRRRLALATSRANFNVARTSAVCLAHRPVLKLKICPTTRGYFQFAPFASLACCPGGSICLAAVQSRVALTRTTLGYVSPTTNIWIISLSTRPGGAVRRRKSIFHKCVNV